MPQRPWQKAHAELTELSRRRAELDWLEGAALLRGLRAEVHRHLGFGSFAEYVERLFGYARRTTDDKLRTAEALETLPALNAALHAGRITWSAIRELARVATADTEQEWLEAARGRTVHDIERMVSGRIRGARPTDPTDPGAQRHVLRFEVSAETLATFREAMRALRQKSASSLDEDSALLLMARQVLGGPSDAGRGSYQIAISTCDHCRRSFQEGLGELVELESSVVEMARCDAQHLGSVESVETQARDASVASRTAAHADPHTHVGAPEGGDDRLDTDRPRSQPDQRSQAAPHRDTQRAQQRISQTIPPALRRKVMRRDHGRCGVPGCRHATFVDLHHIHPRVAGGRHDEDNLIVLCSAHHRAIHRGQLLVSGRVNAGLRFWHADGSEYGAATEARAIDPRSDALRCLRKLGFNEKEARDALQRSAAQLNATEAQIGTEAALRSALALLAEGAIRREVA